MSAEKFIKATAPISVELGDQTYMVKPLSFRDYLAVQKKLRESFSAELTVEQKEEAYIDAIKLLAKGLKLPEDSILDADTDLINELIERFLLQKK